MKVIAGFPWRLDWDISGIAKRVTSCFNAISDQQIQIDIHCLGPATNKTKFRVSKIQVNTTTRKDILAPLVNSIAFSHEFAKIITKKKFDIPHCFNTTSLFLQNKEYLFQTTNPTYAYALDVVKNEYPRTKKYQQLLKYYSMVAELDRLEYENAKMIIANTEVVKENILRYYDVDKSIIHVIPNGVFPEECNFDRPSKKAEEMKIVIFPGTLHMMKGFHYLAKAMVKVRREIPNTILLVCGRIHPYEYELFKKVIDRNRKKSGIIMAGFIPREKLFKYYQLADVCCIPLLYGNMSIAILEAIAHGLPIVTTAHSGISEIEKVGIKVPAKDSEATADAIITLLSNPKLLRIKSANARNLIRNYYWNGIAKKFVDVYENFKN